MTLPVKHTYDVKKVSDLIPYVNNSRTHSDEQINQVASSIKEFGITNPILIDEDNSIIAGHCRTMAMNKLGIEETPVIILKGLSDAQKKAYVIADNKLALNAGWNDELLKIELQALKDEGYDLDLTGFNDLELDDLLPDLTEGLTDEDAVPELPEKPVSQLGDIWMLGDHRLMCGDSTDAGSVALLMDGQKADMVFTDPPYGMSYGGGRAEGKHSLNKKTGGVMVKAHGMIKNDNLQGDDLINLVRESTLRLAENKKEGSPMYICFTWRTYAEFECAIEQAGEDIKACIVWDKKSIGLGNSNYRPQHEFIFYTGGQWYGNKSQADVWYMSRGATGEYVHPTQKPVELIEKAIENSSKKGDVITDAFLGSGSTLIAAHKTGRKCYGMELDPKYCDVIIKRWEEFTGKKATHAESGKDYETLKVERHG